MPGSVSVLPVHFVPSAVQDALHMDLSASAVAFVFAVFPVPSAPVTASITIATTRIAAPIISKYSIAPCPFRSIFFPPFQLNLMQLVMLFWLLYFAIAGNLIKSGLKKEEERQCAFPFIILRKCFAYCSTCWYTCRIVWSAT